MKVYVISSEIGVVYVADKYEIAKQYIDYVYDEYEAWIEEFDTDDVEINLNRKKEMYNCKLGFYCSLDIVDNNMRIEREPFNTDDYVNEFQDGNVYCKKLSGELVAYILADNKDQATKIFLNKVKQYEHDNPEYIERVKNEVEERRRRSIEWRKDYPNLEFYAGKVGSFTASNAKLSLDLLRSSSLDEEIEDIW